VSGDFIVPLKMLGQSGCRLTLGATTVYVDPYLSDSVRELDAPDLTRQVPIAVQPGAVTDADFVLITHEHIDHCDPHTLPLLCKASPRARFVGPGAVLRILAGWGVDAERLIPAEEGWIRLNDDLLIHAVPAAHPTIERDASGGLRYLGFVIEFRGKRIYLAGDTSVQQEIIDAIQAIGDIHTAFLPVNEHNFFRGRRGIIGNMSVREALLLATETGVKQVVAVHWDMFQVNSVYPEEIRLLHTLMAPPFDLLISPAQINLGDVRISVIIRTLNEARHLDELLASIASQDTRGLGVEVVLVDSGSTDGTLEIATRRGCRVLRISREEFSFGRSLNIGCDAAKGDLLVITSGHCIPTDPHWLLNLCKPLLGGTAEYSYGRQIGGPASHFSECQVFSKYYPEESRVPQEGIFCNNANAALGRATWERYRFDEQLTGLEDMYLSRQLVADGGAVAYVADAVVVHHHDETSAQVRRRYEREAIALQKIMPQVHVGILDTCRYILSSIWGDIRARGASAHGRRSLTGIVSYRWNQYVGAWRGNHQHRVLSHAEKDKYFFPH
jgi:L-ascorbate metabolism protein UlaG (beta-lactamase superfamily)/GT2 family glycosyltransferase